MEIEEKKPKLNGESLTKEGNRWLERIRAAKKREEDWAKDAEEAEKAYAQDSGKDTKGKLYDFNILHSNVETIVPAIYNSTPVPDIRRRFGDEDDAAKDWGDILSRVIALQIDDNKLDAEMEAEARDSYTAGRGIIRLRFHADEAETGEADETGAPVMAATNERITTEAVSWRDFAMGKAKRWEDVPWVAFRHCVDREELERMGEGETYAAQIAPSSEKPLLDDEDDYHIWEIWDKRSRLVCFVRDDDGRILRKEDDPLGLSGFFPMPPVLQPISLTGRMTPVCPFTIYKKLANELDTTSKRINKIMAGVKVRAVAIGVAGGSGDLKSLSEADDNEIIVADNLEQLAQTGGLDKAIVWWPIEQAIKVLQQLYQQREQTKASIYEITGISDIVRGASNAGETATAQQIKTQWGSLRIRKMQNLHERQVRDIFAMMAELIASKFSPQTLQTMTGVEMNEQIMALMQQPVLSMYRVNVESDSTVRGDVGRQTEQMAQFLQGTGGYFQTMGPLVAQAPEMAQPVIEIYSAFARTFRLGRQAEEALDRLQDIAKQGAEMAAQQAQQPPQPDPQQIEQMVAESLDGKKLAFEQQKHADEMAFKTKEAEAQSLAQGMKPGPDGMPNMGLMTLMQAIAEMASSINAMAAAQAAPRVINLVRDQNGRPMGAQSVIAQSPSPAMVN